LAYPVASAIVVAANVSDRLTRYTVLQPAAARDFELAILHDMSFSILLPLAGALLLGKARVAREPARSLADIRDAVARALAPAGVRLRGVASAMWLDAVALLGLVLALQFGALAAQATVARVLVTGDESAYWIHLSPALLVGLSVTAGVGEEFVWRGAFLRGLVDRMPWGFAVALQAALFGFIHAGYGNWAHVVGPAMFGALMAIVALRVGLLAAIVVHVGVDVAYLALVAPQLQPQIYALPAVLVVAGGVALIVTRGRAALAVLQGLRELLSRASATRRPAERGRP
jgi:membrane protease YdiL (CAAX protease family)